MFRKISSIFLVAVMVFSLVSTSAFAAEQDDVMPFSLSVPDDPWDLGENDYDANLEVVGKGWLYTNYYFYSNGTGNIYVDYDMTAEGNTVVEFGLYDISQAKMVATWSTSEFGTDGTSGSMYWYNLNMSHGYAIAFRSTTETVTGSAVIRK